MKALVRGTLQSWSLVLLLAAAGACRAPEPTVEDTGVPDAGPDLLQPFDAKGDASRADGPAAPAAAFPRIASYFIETYVGAAEEAVLGKADVAVIDAESGARDPAPLKRIRQKNPAGDLLAYLTSEEIPREPDPTEQPLAAKRFGEIAPAHWLLEPGSCLIAAVDATATRLRVQAPSAFTVKRPPSDFYGEDEPTYLLVEREHVKLIAIQGDELVVQRGYRSTAAAHPAGARIAAHVVFFAGTWMLNLAATAPSDPLSGTWRDRLVAEAASLVKAGPWTGLFLDVCFEDISWLNGGLLDVDRNGKADDVTEASKQWSAGMGLVVDALRTQLGASVPIMANPGAQNCPQPRLDGILLEGWPIGMPPEFLAFETGLDRYLTWSKRPRGFTIANAFSPKIGFGTIPRGADEVARTDYAAMRFGLGVALLGDGLYAFDNGVFGHYVAWWYDEYDGGGLGRGWLGAPTGAPTSQGTARLRQFERGLVVVNLGDSEVTVSLPGGFARIKGTQAPTHNSGAAVGGSLKVPAKDAFLLRRL